MFKVIESKEARGYILKVTKISYPKPVGSNVIDTCLVDAGLHLSPMQIEGHLQYLEERGYVKCTKSKLDITGTIISLVTLTADGVDLLEKTTKDDGIAIK